MTSSVLTLPVSVEQIAAAVKQMNQVDQQRLLELAPELRELAASLPVRTKAQMQANVQQLQAEVLGGANQQQLAADSPFLGNMTLAQYHALPDAEKTRLWNLWGNLDLMNLEEQEVSPHALLAG